MTGKDDVDTLVPLDEDEPAVDLAAAVKAEVVAEAVAGEPLALEPAEEEAEEPVSFDDEDTEVAPELAEEPGPQPVPVPEEPGSVFIDRGPPLPDLYPGRRVRVMVRDPGTLFAYWESDDAVEAWEVTAWRGDVVLHRFHTAAHVRNGYLRVPPGTRGRVTLAPVRAGRAAEPVASITFRTPGDEAEAEGESRWVRVDHEVFEARRAEIVARASAGDPPERAPASLPPAPAPGPEVDAPHDDRTFTSQPPGFPYTRDDR
jgi:hypothetical protein